MTRIDISISGKESAYPVFVDRDILGELPRYLKEHHPGKRLAVVIDETVEKSHGTQMRELLQDAALWIPVRPGEPSKSREEKASIEDRLLDAGCGRDTVLIAIGGGVIGDLTGFVAATFNRGLPVIHVPTSLLAMVDSSIGGKTGINTRHGKNLIGAVHQPSAVFTDLRFMDSLPEDEFFNGLAEVVKMAAARDKDLFRLLEQRLHDIRGRDQKTIKELVARSIALKKEVVEQDEQEQGQRQVLNLGHTIGHAIEASSGYTLKHGHCVSMGLVAEARLSCILDVLPEEDFRRVHDLIKELGLPHTLKEADSADKLLGFMKTDKKAKEGKPHVVLLKRIGDIKREEGRFSFPADEDSLRKAIEGSRHD